MLLARFVQTVSGMSEEPKFDARLAEGVAYFEQMLQIMPEDRTTLEFLVVAYDQLGRHDDGQKALVSLAKILVKDRDIEALEGLLPRLEASDSAEARALSLKVRSMVAPAPDLTPESPRELTDSERAAMVSRAAISAEKSLVDSLAHAGLLEEEAAGHVLAQLEAMPTDGRVFLISALQILEKENLPLAERCFAHLADEFGAPPVPLAAFDPPRDLVAKFPAATLRIRGAVPFAVLGKAALVAVLNPADESLRAELSAAMPCRFYIAEAGAVESALASLFPSEEAQG
jgi:hypothetical protein